MKIRRFCAAVLAVLMLSGCAQTEKQKHPYPLDADRIREDTEYMSAR